MLNTLRSCRIEVEIATSFFLRYHVHNEEQATLQNELRNIDKSLPSVIITPHLQIYFYVVTKSLMTKKCALLMRNL